MSDIDDDFPPEKWLNKHFSPNRLALLVVVLFVGLILLPPSLSMQVGMVGVYILIPSAVLLIIWRLVWFFQHPLAPPEYCDKCKHMLPRQYQKKE